MSFLLPARLWPKPRFSHQLRQLPLRPSSRGDLRRRVLGSKNPCFNSEYVSHKTRTASRASIILVFIALWSRNDQAQSAVNTFIKEHSVSLFKAHQSECTFRNRTPIIKFGEHFF